MPDDIMMKLIGAEVESIADVVSTAVPRHCCEPTVDAESFLPPPGLATRWISTDARTSKDAG